MSRYANAPYFGSRRRPCPRTDEHTIGERRARAKRASKRVIVHGAHEVEGLTACIEEVGAGREAGDPAGDYPDVHRTQIAAGRDEPAPATRTHPLRPRRPCGRAVPRSSSGAVLREKAWTWPRVGRTQARGSRCPPTAAGPPGSRSGAARLKPAGRSPRDSVPGDLLRGEHRPCSERRRAVVDPREHARISWRPAFARHVATRTPGKSHRQPRLLDELPVLEALDTRITQERAWRQLREGKECVQ